MDTDLVHPGAPPAQEGQGEGRIAGPDRAFAARIAVVQAPVLAALEWRVGQEIPAVAPVGEVARGRRRIGGHGSEARELRRQSFVLGLEDGHPGEAHGFGRRAPLDAQPDEAGRARLEREHRPRIGRDDEASDRHEAAIRTFGGDGDLHPARDTEGREAETDGVDDEDAVLEKTDDQFGTGGAGRRLPPGGGIAVDEKGGRRALGSAGRIHRHHPAAEAGPGEIVAQRRHALAAPQLHLLHREGVDARACRRGREPQASYRPLSATLAGRPVRGLRLTATATVSQRRPSEVISRRSR